MTWKGNTIRMRAWALLRVSRLPLAGIQRAWRGCSPCYCLRQSHYNISLAYGTFSIYLCAARLCAAGGAHARLRAPGYCCLQKLKKEENGNVNIKRDENVGTSVSGRDVGIQASISGVHRQRVGAAASIRRRMARQTAQTGSIRIHPNNSLRFAAGGLRGADTLRAGTPVFAITMFFFSVFPLRVAAYALRGVF